jgi:hypothetical protein
MPKKFEPEEAERLVRNLQQDLLSMLPVEHLHELQSSVAQLQQLCPQCCKAPRYLEPNMHGKAPAQMETVFLSLVGSGNGKKHQNVQ